MSHTLAAARAVIAALHSLLLTTQSFHSNWTTPEIDFYLEPQPGFTHVRTPNSHFDHDEIIGDALGQPARSTPQNTKCPSQHFCFALAFTPTLPSFFSR